MTDSKGKDSIMKLLLSRPNPNVNSLERKYARDSEDGESSKLSNYLQRLSGQIEGRASTVELDHTYSRPWNWRPENSYTKPVKTLFITRASNIVRPSIECVDPEQNEENPTPVYDGVKARSLMDECEKHISLVRSDSGDPDWQDNINTIDWSTAQVTLFEKVCNVLNSDRMSRLSMAGSWNEPVLRRIVISKSACRFRMALAAADWDPKLVTWLHNLLMENLDTPNLVAYVDILQTLRAKIPTLIDRMVASSAGGGKYSTDALNLLLQRPWDPSIFSLPKYNPKRLPGNPLILIVPHSPGHLRAGKSRTQRWQAYLSHLGTVVSVMGTNSLNSQIKLTMMSTIEQMMAATRAKLAELKSDNIGRNIILVGLNSGAALACQVALLEHVTAVVCLGFPLNTAEDKRGQPEDGILNLNIPVLFVVGQYAATSNVDDMEDLRERLHVETGLVVVGAADDHLRITKAKQSAEGITQSMVDRCIVDEVGDFIGTILSNPYSSARERPRLKLIEKKRKISIQDDLYAKKPRSGGGGGGGGGRRARPAAPRVTQQVKSKWTAQVHRSFDMKPRSSYMQGTSGTLASITRTPAHSDKLQASSSRPSIDNISVVNSASNDGDSVCVDPSSGNLLPQIKVLGSEEINIVGGADSSLVDELTPDSLLEMPVIIAQEDPMHDTSPVKVLVSSKPSRSSVPAIKCIGKGQKQVNYTKIFIQKKDMSREAMRGAAVFMDTRKDESGPRIRHIPATKHSNSDMY